ncbi:MAG: ATP-grasp domain-containing protein, partial [Verrucomicrobia bacterium]|nr:ATP-grasp domain-containing protein [Verrucomicrobiota bacterium]
GPRSSVIKAMGDKAVAKQTARKAGAPVVPGSDGPVESEQDALKVAKKISYPVIIKAVAGGGGRGMRVAHNDVSLVKGYHTARSEAEKAFANPAVYIEKYIEAPRHIEVQVLGDQKGRIVHLFERECSIQRRHQKLLEEAPSPALNEDLRKRITRAAVRVAEGVEYTNAGTVEFLLDAKGSFYFMEMNTRIQVEHPVTEAAVGIDIVKEQIRIAAGEPLSFEQRDLRLIRHAMECRINAEDPDNGFRPSPGKIEFLYTPGGHGVRVDSHCYAGYIIPPNYDSMIAKLITFGYDRRTVIERMNRALSEYIIHGVKTTIPLQRMIMQDPDFRRGRFSTSFIENLLGTKQREVVEET